jgi:hypothetical protein
MGSSFWSKGRLYLIRKRLDIRLPFPLRFRLVPTLLLVMVCAALPQVEGQAGGPPQACGGDSTVDVLGEQTATSARAFLAQLQSAVQSNNKEEIAGMIGYPVLVLRSGKRTYVTEEAGIPDKLRTHLYGSCTRCHSASDSPMPLRQFLRGNGRQR